MNTVYKVQNVENNLVMIAPLTDSACQNCSKKCSSCNLVFPVLNNKNIPVVQGQKVKIKMSPKNELKRVLFCLVFPVASAVLGFFIASFIGVSKNEVTQSAFCALCSFLFLLFSCAFVLIRTKKMHTPEQIEIAEVV